MFLVEKYIAVCVICKIKIDIVYNDCCCFDCYRKQKMDKDEWHRENLASQK